MTIDPTVADPQKPFARAGGIRELRPPPVHERIRECRGPMIRPRLFAPMLASLWICGCGSVGGPSLSFTAPRVSGQVLDAETGKPVARAMVGRTLWTHRRTTGGFLKAAEEQVLRQDFATTDASGRFVLPEQQVALLFSLGETRPNLRLAVSHSRHLPWTTNYPMSALEKDPQRPSLDAGSVLLEQRKR